MHPCGAPSCRALPKRNVRELPGIFVMVCRKGREIRPSSAPMGPDANFTLIGKSICGWEAAAVNSFKAEPRKATHKDRTAEESRSVFYNDVFSGKEDIRLAQKEHSCYNRLRKNDRIGSHAAGQTVTRLITWIFRTPDLAEEHCRSLTVYADPFSAWLII